MRHDTNDERLEHMILHSIMLVGLVLAVAAATDVPNRARSAPAPGTLAPALAGSHRCHL
jgi:hypothetical protein